ncbi:hypothetical protein [Butyricicoccus pullicaecorum]
MIGIKDLDHPPIWAFGCCDCKMAMSMLCLALINIQSRVESAQPQAL